MAQKPVIELDDIRRDFIVGEETVHALRGVSFTIHEGEFVTIMGTSGSGKSTLLNILGCLDTPTSGEYCLDGTPVRTMSDASFSASSAVFMKAPLPVLTSSRMQSAPIASFLLMILEQISGMLSTVAVASLRA